MFMYTDFSTLEAVILPGSPLSLGSALPLQNLFDLHPRPDHSPYSKIAQIHVYSHAKPVPNLKYNIT